MNHLSDESIKKVLSSLKSEKDNLAMEELRKSCYRVNNIIVSNDFHKTDADSLECTWSFIERKMMTKVCDVILLPKTNGTVEEPDEMEKPRRTRKVRQRIVKNKKEMPLQIPFNCFSKDHLILGEYLQQSVQNLASIKEFRITWLVLNSELLEIIKQHEAVISSATSVIIRSCEIEWNSDELLQFLKIFKSLKELSITNSPITKPIITDEHISLISEKIVVVNKNRGNGSLHLPHVTSQSSKTWLKKDMKLVIFERISSEISYSGVKEYMDTLVEKANPVNNDWFPSKATTPNFGDLKYCEDDLRQIVLSQRKRNIDWKIEPQYEYKQCYTVTATGMKYKFRVDIPYLPPDFQKLLIVVIELQAKLEGDDVIDENEQNEISTQFYGIGDDLYDYKMAKHLLNEVIPPPEEGNNAVELHWQRDWRPYQLKWLRNYAHEIRYRIRQLEENEKIAA